MADFKPGDVVRLKNGNPPMTVEKIKSDTPSHLVEVVWFEGSDLYRNSIKPELLEIAPGFA